MPKPNRSSRGCLKFHIKNKELFIQLAVAIDLLAQLTAGKPTAKVDISRNLLNIKNNLLWLQDNYQIAPKSKSKR